MIDRFSLTVNVCLECEIHAAFISNNKILCVPFSSVAPSLWHAPHRVLHDAGLTHQPVLKFADSVRADALMDAVESERSLGTTPAIDQCY
jgi:hypothetical protein